MTKLPRTTEDVVVIAGDVWNDLCDAVEASGNLKVAPPLELKQVPGGNLLSLRADIKLVIRMKITGTDTGGGKYQIREFQPPTTDVPATGNLSEAELGTVFGPTMRGLNRREAGQSTHDLATSAFLPLVFEAYYLRTNSDGTKVYDFDGLQHEDCEAPP